MDLRKSYGFTDKSLETDGVWVEITSGASVKVARANNKHFKNRMKHLLKPHEGRIQRKRMDEDLLEELTLKALSEHVLLDWKGIELDGKKLKYSPEVGCKMMREFDDFAEDVLWAASERETFRKDIVEENVKNS